MSMTSHLSLLNSVRFLQSIGILRTPHPPMYQLLPPRQSYPPIWWGCFPSLVQVVAKDAMYYWCQHQSLRNVPHNWPPVMTLNFWSPSFKPDTFLSGCSPSTYPPAGHKGLRLCWKPCYSQGKLSLPPHSQLQSQSLHLWRQSGCSSTIKNLMNLSVLASPKDLDVFHAWKWLWRSLHNLPMTKLGLSTLYFPRPSYFP